MNDPAEILHTGAPAPPPDILRALESMVQRISGELESKIVNGPLYEIRGLRAALRICRSELQQIKQVRDREARKVELASLKKEDLQHA